MSDTTSRDERRRTPRVKATHELILTPEGDPVIPARSVDINLGGIYCVLERHVGMFSKMQLELELPILDDEGGTHVFQCGFDAVVVRVEPEEPGPDGTKYKCAMAFVNIDEDVELVLARYLLQTLVRPEG